jgi:hypothetical protein
VNRAARPQPQSVTTLINTSLSAAIDLGAGNRQLTGVIMPAAWTTASVTFAVSADGVTYHQLYYGAGVYTINAAAGAAAALAFSVDPNAFIGWPFVKIQSGTVASAVNQAAARTFTVLTRAT